MAACAGTGDRRQLSSRGRGGNRRHCCALHVLYVSDDIREHLQQLQYAYWAHKFTQKITGSLLGQVQYSSFQGGTFDGETETSYLLNLSVEYALTKHFSAEFGYIYETLVAGSNASFDRGYSRNQVYMGVRASY